jgi:hypothetical protein
MADQHTHGRRLTSVSMDCGIGNKDNEEEESGICCAEGFAAPIPSKTARRASIINGQRRLEAELGRSAKHWHLLSHRESSAKNEKESDETGWR